MDLVVPGKIKSFLLLLLILTNLSVNSQEFTDPENKRIKINIDEGWLFINRDFPHEEETHQVNDLKWESVDIPHDWTISGEYSREHNTTQGFLPMDIGWYRKGLRFPESYEGKKIFLLFDGVYRSSDVWMNYAHMGHHESGYTSFYYDVTDYVRTGNRIPNGLRVRVDGRRHEQDMYEGNGIFRHVWILVTDRLHIDMWGVFVSTPKVSDKKATVKIQTEIKNEYPGESDCELKTTIFDASGNIVGEAISSKKIRGMGGEEFIQHVDISKPRLWDIEDPYLYNVLSVVKRDGRVVDSDKTTLGIRTFRFDADDGFFLNGRHVKLKGFNAHYDFAGLGTAVPDRIHWNAMKAMKKAGFNFYRSSHNPATPERLEVCDSLGILVWDEIERKLESRETEMQLVRETIIRDRNHPGIILWSLENESPLESTVYGTEIIKEATSLAHELDPMRLTTFAASMPVNKNGYGDAADVVSYNYHWKRADEDHNNFPHWKIGLISEYSAARGRRGVYGTENFERAENDSYFDLYNGMVNSMYEMCTTVESYWQRIKNRDYIGGGCLWSGIDAWGEGNAWPLVSRGDGALDLCFFPKDVYYYFVSQWTKEPMVHIFPHWNWENKKGGKIDVWCYTNCDSVELFLNGESLGIQKSLKNKGKDEIVPEHLAWDVVYEPGTLRAVGFIKGKIVCTEDIHTASEPHRIELDYMMKNFVDESEIPPYIADGKDVVVIKASVVDASGNLVPTADNLITFKVDGDQKIIGVGNGNIASHESNKADYRKAYNGMCAVIVRTSKTAGDFKITATSPGLERGEIVVRSVKRR